MAGALGRLAMLAASLAVAFGAGELALRLATPPGHPERSFENIDFLRTDPALGWRNQPNLDAESVTLAQHRHAARLRTDSRGFRSPEAAPGAAAGVRIVCLGDSVTFGYWVEGSIRDPERATVHFDGYVDELRRLLLAEEGGDAEVLNAGVLGYSSSHGLRQLVLRILPLRPDVVTVRFGYNDHTRSPHPQRRPHEPRGALARALLHASLDLRAVRLGLEAYQRFPALHPAPWSVPWVEPERFAANLRRFAALAREHDFRLLFIDYPLASPEATAPGDLELFVRLAGAHATAQLYAEHAAYQEILVRVAREEGVPLLASAPALLGAAPPAFEAADPVHLNGAGARTLGRLLRDELAARGWLAR